MKLKTKIIICKCARLNQIHKINIYTVLKCANKSKDD